jgi:hypothetical protein
VFFLTEQHATKACWGSEGTAPRINLSVTWRWVVSFTSRPFYARGRKPRFPSDRRLGGPQRRSGRGGELKKILLMPNIEPRSSSPQTRHYTYWAIPALNCTAHVLLFSIWRHINLRVTTKLGARIAQRYSARLRAGWSDVESRQGLGIFLFTITTRPALGPSQSPIQWAPGAFSGGKAVPGREADHSPPSSAEVLC